MDRVICSAALMVGTIIYLAINWVNEYVPEEITASYVLFVLVLFVGLHAYSKTHG